MLKVAKGSQGELENNYRKLRDQTKTRHSDCLKMGQLTLSQFMVKKGYDVAVDDDDALKTSVSQNRVTATLCTEEVFLRTQYILIALSTYQSGENVWGSRDGQHNTWISPGCGSHLSANPPCV